jgi:peptidoglycan/LPS O-acetylase OafA/YrhL
MDSLRAIAVMCVFFFHAFDNVDTASAVTAELKIGVTIFFVISGFLLYRPYVSRHLEGQRGPLVRDFARRRVLRIVPAYWVALTVGAVILGLSGVFSEKAWAYYGFVQAYRTDTILNGIPVAWSLCVEVTFYALLPVYAMVAFRLTGRYGLHRAVATEAWLLALVTLGSLIVRTVVERSSGYTVFVWATLPGTFYWFALGMALALASAALARRAEVPASVRLVSRAPSAAWLVALALFAAVVIHEGAPGREPFDPAAPGDVSVLSDLGNYLAFGLIALCVALPAVFVGDSPSVVRRILGMRWLGWLGLVSYGVFLWHVPLFDQIGNHNTSDPLAWRIAFAAAASVAIAAVSYYVVERPLLRLKDRRRVRA